MRCVGGRGGRDPAVELENDPHTCFFSLLVVEVAVKVTETGENAPVLARNGLESVVGTGDYRASLEALRDTLAAGIAGAGERQLIHLAPLAKQLADVMRTLAEMPVPGAAADSVESAQNVIELKLRTVR